LAQNIPSLPNIKTGAHQIKRILLIGQSSPHSVPFRSKLGKVISISRGWRNERIYSCDGKSTSWFQTIVYGQSVAQVLRAFTTSALTRYKERSAEYIFTQRAKSMPLYPYIFPFSNMSTRFQQLELKHVEDRGCFPAMEFR
jgi:hypothetical protein